jgi:cellulose synthase/poly-beta-1,6-N-acetylglucosamine synthase-like glycosyltransferase
MIAALLAPGCLLLAAALHPFVTYPLSLRLIAWRGRRPIRQGKPPARVALCVCAYNEAAVIEAKIHNMLAQRERVPGLELFVHIDASADATAEIAHRCGGGVHVVESAARLGKTHGMNTLVAMTSADIVVFTDANVEFAPDAVAELVAPFADPEVGCVCGELRYREAGASGTAAAGSLYWRLEEGIKRLESETGSIMGADGSIFAIRRSLHAPPPADLIDDMYVSLSVLLAGSRIVRAPSAVAYEPAVSRSGEEFRRKIRIACQAFNVHRALWPRLRRMPALDLYKYVSHKLLRWITILPLALGGILVAMAAALALAQAGEPLLLAAAAIVAAGGACAMLLARGGMLATCREILTAFVATGIGVQRSLSGQRFQTWEPPSSARLRLRPGAHGASQNAAARPATTTVE